MWFYLVRENKMKTKKRQRKRCKLESCKKLFTPTRNFQKCCDFDCDIKYVSNKDNLRSLIDDGKKRNIKKANIEKRAFNQSDKSKLKEKAQQVVNKYIRLRDNDFPCISCGTIANIQYAAGHFRPAGNNQHLRYNTNNIHKQCNMNCNMNKSGNLIPYRINLIKKIGLKKVEELEKNNEVKKYSIEYLNKLIRIFKRKIKKLEKRICQN